MRKSREKNLKISKLKRNNQKRTKLVKQGKIKKQRQRNNKLELSPGKQNVFKTVKTSEEEENDSGEDLLGMMELDDFTFLKSSVTHKTYNPFEPIKLSRNMREEIDNSNSSKNKRKLWDDKSNDLDVETEYEDNILNVIENDSGKKLKVLLPVKTKEGIIKKRIIGDTIKNDIINEELRYKNEYSQADINATSTNNGVFLADYMKNKLSTVELLVYRDKILQSRKLKIGLLSSNLLENPHLKLDNLKLLLSFMNETNPEVCITVKKLAIISLLEIFKDLLPSYYINQVKEEGIKYKKEILELRNYELTLVSSYKHYLQKLEKIARKLRNKKGNTRASIQSELELGQIAVFSMCQLIIAHPYFNYSLNIINFLVPLLDNSRQETREMVLQCFSQIFINDKRGEISLNIVRKLNQYIKQHGASINPEFISVLLHLRIRDINLDDLRKEEVRQKKLDNHKHKLIVCSKKERKKNKKLEEIEREMLETKAVESKARRQKKFAEIINIVFTIYFRILKQTPTRKILSVCLEGLAKYSACISLEFYQDLVNVVNSLMHNNNLGQKEQLYCIQTVFTILSGQASALSLDPYIFHVHLYKQLFHVHAAKPENNGHIIEILIQALINRRKRITQCRLIAFVKRITSIALHMQHHGALGILGVVKSIMQLDTQTHILLDTDFNSGEGFYQAELEEPEFCNAHCTALWELIALQRHHHSIVQKFSTYIACGVPTNGEGILSFDITKSTPQELFQIYDPINCIFKPVISIPKKSEIPKKVKKHNFNNGDLENYIRGQRRKSLLTRGLLDFYKEYA